jgi:hypothetical protein
MKTVRAFLALSLTLCLALPFAGCTQYCAVRRVDPVRKVGSPGGVRLARELSRAGRDSTAALGACTDAAAAAERRLRGNPGDAPARADYNFAVSRIFEIVHRAKLRPWDAPVRVPGAQGEWALTFQETPGADPRKLAMRPADRYDFHGSYVRTRSLKDGLGAPLVLEGREQDFTQTDRLAQGKRVYYGMTGLLRFDGRRCVLSTEDPLTMEKVKVAGRSFPLAADFTAPLALATVQEKLWVFALQRLLWPQRYAYTTRIARLEPYDAKKIPVICVHGLIDSPTTWVPVINTLRGDAEIRRRYQFWFFSYPSGLPYPYSASVMRQQLDVMNARYPGHKKEVLIGHSMGGTISRTMITDSGMKIWDAYFQQPPADLAVSDTVRDVLKQSLIFQHRPEVGRVIFISTPHRGADKASGWLAKTFSRLVKVPHFLLNLAEETRYVATPEGASKRADLLPNSIETLLPDNPFVKTINTLPFTPGVPYHSIIGDRGLGGNNDRTEPVRSDGYVPYWSSHLPGAQSEAVVPADHRVQHSPQGIAEVRRILRNAR